MINVYIMTLFASASISIFVLYLAWKRRDSQGGLPLVIMMGGISVWILFQALQVIIPDFNIKVIFANMRYFGIELAPIAFYALAREYENKKRSFTPKWWIAAFIFPLMAIIMLWTNPMHHLFYTDVRLENGILILDSGIVFYIQMAYLYIFIAMSILCFIRAFIKQSSIYRRQAGVLAASALVPLVANFLYIFNVPPFGMVDMTPFSFFFTAILFYYALNYLGLLDLVPVARDRLMEEMDDVIMVLDKQGRIWDLNRKAKELALRCNPQNREYIGKGISNVFSGWSELKDIVEEGTIKADRIVYRVADNSSNRDITYYDLRISDIFDNKERCCGELIVLRDITKLEMALLEARQAREEAERANLSKGYFLANMSHEIRTPMNAIIGIAEILKSDELDNAKQKEYVGIVLDSAQTLLTIINDILDFSKMDMGKLELEEVEFNISDIVNEVTAIFGVITEKKSILLRHDVDERINCNLIGDPVRVRQIISNLLSNSIKFTHSGYIDVKVKQISRDESSMELLVAVEDTGIGIPENKLETIFESFKQGDSSTTRQYGGTGLGLAIVKNILSLMGGTISVTSVPEKGSSFCCTIPFKISPWKDQIQSEQFLTQTADAEDLVSAKNINILVVDDNQVNREIIRIHLDKLGYNYDFAENGVIACEKYSSGTKYDIILMDVQMPEMDGLEATRRIRQMEQNAGNTVRTAVFALTAGAMKEEVERCMEAGMDQHIAKPVRFAALKRMLEAYVRINEAE